MTRTLVSAATLLASVSLAATAAARPMTAEDVAKLETVGELAVSPDGSRIAYTTSRRPDVTAGEDNGGSEDQLKLAYGPDSARDFLPADIDVSAVRFSPDGRMVSFLHKAEDEKRAVWGIPVDGGGHRKLAEIEDAHLRDYAWSPDGATLYLLAAAAPDKALDKRKKAGFDAVVYEEEADLNRLFAARVGHEVDSAPRAIDIPGHVSGIQVASDGTTAIVESAPSPLVDDSYTSKRVHILDLARGRVLRAVETPGKLGDVEISPDGSRLSLIAAVDANDPAATTLHMADVATGTYRALNAGAPEATSDAEFLPDGRLAAIVDVGAQSVLRIYSAEGDVLEEHDPGALILSDLEVGGGTIAVEAHSPEHPPELYVVSDGQFTRWTRHNPWLAEIDMGAQRTFTYTARDGQEIEGVLIEPVGSIPRGGAPVIFDVHGGPEAHESNGWQTYYSSPGQVAAGRGYAVFMPNYRGSTGYGTAFSKQHQGDYAGKEFDDLVDGKRALVEAGIADPDRVGLTGGSYGGFATAWGSTYYSQEFAAGVMFVGISNNVSKFGTTDIPNEMYLVHERKWPWEEWDHLMERSPIYHVDKAETPLLIMHGDSDTRVSPTQSYELYRHMKTRKPETPVRLVLYPGEGHGNQKAAARYDYSVRMMEWFDTYLKPGNRNAPLPAPRPELKIDEEGED
ncbi:alpha/beta hydrolase family protein [Pelagerythrobacter marensis]|uniref:Peptidase S9 family protein n=1 Tax=Pelagerythrobacter marensis TaxID=543877 RepID=A0A0G3X3Z0_9SPHN|nr:S9 family peptidase [Pelagerythrobacter marensis]AKM06250.1 Peptidase S9 family protein [Pelagerythrobacter marensis]